MMFISPSLRRFALVVLVASAAVGPVGPAFAFKRTFKGEELQDFTLENVAQAPVRLIENLGDKATVLIFWASWSPRSAEALGEFQELYAEHQGEGLQVIAVNVEHQEMSAEQRRAISTLVATKGLTYPVLVDDGLRVFNDYGVIAVPSLALADADGKILELLEGYSNMTRCDFRDRVLKALGILQPVVEAPPEVGVYCPVGKAARYYQMGELFLRKKMARRAAKAFRRAVKEDPKYAEAYVRLAEVLELRGDETAAAEAREQAAALGMAPRPPEAATDAEEGVGSPTVETAIGGDATAPPPGVGKISADGTVPARSLVTAPVAAEQPPARPSTAVEPVKPPASEPHLQSPRP